MSSTVMIAAIATVVILVVGLVTLVPLRIRRTGDLRGQFGDAEYDRAVDERGSQRMAEAELEGRAERVEGFEVRHLAPVDQARYENAWHGIQRRFSDSPGSAVAEADRVLHDVLSTCGYPPSEHERRAADLSVHHPSVVKDYRAVHEIALARRSGQAGTDDLYQAMIHYRALFEELVGDHRTAMRDAV